MIESCLEECEWKTLARGLDTSRKDLRQIGANGGKSHEKRNLFKNQVKTPVFGQATFS
jgi:hypothetical protein